MTASATTYAESGRARGMGIPEWNALLLARQPERRRGVRTPEFYFVQRFDNSRLVKAPDLRRTSQMRVFSVAAAFLLLLTMVYGLQHFSAIESSYRVEREKQALDNLKEENRQLRLAEAQLTDPARLDEKAHELGLVEPQPGQVVHPGYNPAEQGSPTLAQEAEPASAAR